MNNEIATNAILDKCVQMGDGNEVHEGCVIGGFKGGPCRIRIGDGNYFGPGVRIQAANVTIGSNCKFHNGVTMFGESIVIGDNCWVGQMSHLDGHGDLTIGDNVTIGYNCYIWTHAGREGLPAGCNLVGKDSVLLGDSVWLMGANVVVNPGVTMAAHSAALSNAVVTHDTASNCVYVGVPAKVIPGMKAWRLRSDYSDKGVWCPYCERWVQEGHEHLELKDAGGTVEPPISWSVSWGETVDPSVNLLHSPDPIERMVNELRRIANILGGRKLLP